MYNVLVRNDQPYSFILLLYASKEIPHFTSKAHFQFELKNSQYKLKVNHLPGPNDDGGLAHKS